MKAKYFSSVPNIKSGPQFSFGYRNIEAEHFELRPGPGAYNIDDSFQKIAPQSYKSLVIPKGDRFLGSYTSSFTPGPGSYVPVMSPKDNSGKIFPFNSTGPRGFNIKRKSTSLGPGAYNVASDILKNARATRFGAPSSKSDRSNVRSPSSKSLINNSTSSVKQQKASAGARKEIYIEDKSLGTVKNGSKFDSFLNESLGNTTFSKQRRNFSWLPKLNTPGPGNYNVGRNIGIHKERSHYTISDGSMNNLGKAKGLFKTRSEMELPGPGQYELNDDSFDRISRFSSGGGTKGFSFKRFKPRGDETFLNEASLFPGPGSFKVGGGNFFEKGPKIGTARRPFLGQSVGGPGPGSYTVFSENSFRRVKRGTKRKNKTRDCSPNLESSSSKPKKEGPKVEMVIDKKFLAYSLYGKKKKAYFLKKIEPPKKLEEPKKPQALQKMVKATNALKLLARFDFGKSSILNSEPIQPLERKPFTEPEKAASEQKPATPLKILEENKPRKTLLEIKKSGKSFGSSLRTLEFLNLGISANPSPQYYDIDRNLDKRGQLLTKDKRKELFEVVLGPGPGSYSGKESSFKLAATEKKVLPKPRGLKIKRVKKLDTESSVGSSKDVVKVFIPEKKKI